MNVIITMAGEGRRFREAGFAVPKHRIEVRGKSLLAWSLESLRSFYQHSFIFVSRREYIARSEIEQSCRTLGIAKYEHLELPEPTDGQATSALLARPAIEDAEAPILIYNIDTYVEPWALQPEMIKGDGWIPAFSAAGDHWSFVTFDPAFKVTAITEKIRISEFATVGLYFFGSFNLYEECYRQCRFEGYREKFVAPLYQRLIEDPCREVYTTVLAPAAVHVLGTPEDIRNWAPEFHSSRT
ncbi:MAG: NTP transferase domain-containing protein [Oligoflexia bacterium]|nr:NTP transferase domain-containing protein [Oligoflexia bacterium]